MKLYLLAALRTTTGVLLSATAAVALAAYGARISPRAWLPWIFAGILIAISARFGPMVSLLGSLLAILIFARNVYAPIGSIHVSDKTAQADLAWMALIAVAGSYLLFPPNRHPRHRA
jgi:K+-sensing histidine kinase KdpD